MRPIGFESRARRFERSLHVGLVAGVVTVSVAMALIVFASNPTATHTAFTVAALAFGLGFFAGFVLAFMRPDFAPPQPKDDGDAEAGVLARLVPPAPTLRAKAFPESDEKPA
jgi:hypothetical protein